jgi:hypothetical protein
MPQFPKLRTGSVMQHPMSREVSFTTEQVRFQDGSEQRYRISAGGTKRWIVPLELLDEHEAQELERFFCECMGKFASFAFIDPTDDAEYADCSLDQDYFSFTAAGEMRRSAALVIKQNG